MNPEKVRQNDYEFKNTLNIENKLLRFQIYSETELDCKYSTPLYKTQYWENLVEYEQGFDMNTGKLVIIDYLTDHPSNQDEHSYLPVTLLKNTGITGGKVKSQDNSSKLLRELSLMNNTYFGTIHYYIHLDMKLHYTIGRIFHEMSFSELETLYHVCELERTQILQPPALVVLRINHAGYLLSRNRSNYEGLKKVLWRKYTMVLHLYKKKIIRFWRKKMLQKNPHVLQN